MTPTPDEVRLALAGILDSEIFAPSDRHKSFLRYITEETLAGRGDRIKGYSVAVEVFGKAPDFDAQSDPYVRVEAGRLRKRLAEYYRSAGVNDRVRIELERGNYAPRFSYHPAATPTDGKPAEHGRWLASLSGRWSGIAIAATILVIVAATAGTLWLARGGDVSGSGAAGGPPTIRIQRFVEVNSSDFAYFADGLHNELQIALGRFESVWGPLNVFPIEYVPIPGAEFAHDYFLDGTLSRLDDAVHITVRLVDGSSGALIWSWPFDGAFELAEVVVLQKEVATMIANSLRDPFGPLADAEIRKIAGLPVESLSTYQCNVLFLAATDKLSRATRNDARSCLERHDAAGALDATGLGALAYLYHLDFEDGRDLIDGSLPSDDLAYETANRAIEDDNNDVLARMALISAQITRKDLDAAVQSMEELVSLNPPTSMLGIAALLITKLGDSGQGMSFFHLAFGQSWRPTASLHLAPAVLFLQQGNFDEALSSVIQMEAPDSTMFNVFRTALNALLDRPDQAESAGIELLRLHPQFASYGRELIDRWALPAEVNEVLVTGLERAGIGLE